MKKLKVGDLIRVTIGKDKGREGKIEKVFPKRGAVLVPGLNLYKKHVKGVGGQTKGGIYEIPRPLQISKVALICPKCKKTTRVGLKIINKQKVRICQKCKRQIDL